MFEGSLVAIDIGSYALKILELGSGVGQKKVVSAGFRVLPHGLVSGSEILDSKLLVIQILDLLKEMKVRRFHRRAAISIGASSALSKRVGIIPDQSLDIADQIFQEAENQFHVDMNELYLDYHVENRKQGQLEEVVILAAAKRETLNERVALVENAGLKIGVIDTDTFSLVNILEHTYGLIRGLIVMVHIGHLSTNIIFLKDGKYLSSREFAMGGDHYTQGLAKELSISSNEAEDLKIKVSLFQMEAGDSMIQALSSLHDQFITELQMTIDSFFQNEELDLRGIEISRIFLAGGGAPTLGLAVVMGEKMGLPVDIFDPFASMKVPRNFRGVANLRHKAIFAVAAGLALRDLQEK